jgi:hypothetical protein
MLEIPALGRLRWEFQLSLNNIARLPALPKTSLKKREKRVKFQSLAYKYISTLLYS